jgi:hypothetical protein
MFKAQNEDAWCLIQNGKKWTGQYGTGIHMSYRYVGTAVITQNLCGDDDDDFRTCGNVSDLLVHNDVCMKRIALWKLP